MKVRMKKNTVQYSGKLDGLLYYYHSGLEVTLARRKPQMPLQQMNTRYKNISKALKKINPSAQYKQNFKDYLVLLKEFYDDITMISWHNLYVKMMWNLEKQNPSIDLTKLTRQQIVEQDLPVRTLKKAVEAGLLPKAKGYTKFTAAI